MKKEISLIKLFFIILDFIFFFLSLSLVLYFRFPSDFLLKLQDHVFPFLFLFPFYLLFLLSFNFYNFYFFNLKNLFIAFLNFFISAFIFSVFYFYFSQVIFSISPKTNLLLFLIFFSLFLILSRFFFLKIFSREKLPVYFWGNEQLGEKLKKDLLTHPLFIYQGTSLYPDFGILVVSPSYQFKEKILPYFLKKKIVIFDFVDFYEKFLGRIPLEAINFDWIIREIFLGEAKVYFYLKRIIDLILASLVFIFLFIPLFLPIAILIYINSPGPIFFSQERIGYRGKIFKLIKFRTMHPQTKKEQKWAVGDEEKRIFFFGKILRKTHLDELPQIFNILRGELSFVGPRPEQPKIFTELEKEVPFYELRCLTLPGLTGWAQINYKYPENLEETKIKLEYDLYYLKNSNLFLDILIIIKTFQKFLTF